MADLRAILNRLKQQQGGQLFGTPDYMQPQMQTAQPASTAVERPLTPEEEEEKRQRELAGQRAFVKAGAPAPIAQGAQAVGKVAVGMGKNLESRINKMMIADEISRRGWMPTEAGIKIYTKQQRESAAQYAAAEGLNLTMWYSGYAPAAVSANLRFVAQKAKPLLYKLVDKLTAKQWSDKQIRGYLDKINTPGAVFSEEEKALMPKLEAMSEQQGIPLGKLITKASKEGVKVPAFRGGIPTKPFTWQERTGEFFGAGPIAKKGGEAALPKEGITSGVVGKVAGDVAKKLTPTETEVIRKPLGSITKTPETGEKALIEHAYDPKTGQPVEYQSYFMPKTKEYRPLKVGLAGGRAKDVIGGEVGLGNLPATPEEPTKSIITQKTLANKIGELIEEDTPGNMRLAQELLIAQKQGKSILLQKLDEIFFKNIPATHEAVADAKYYADAILRFMGEEATPALTSAKKLPPPAAPPPPATTTGAIPSAEQPITPQEAIDIVTAKIKLTKPMRKEVEAKYTMERGKRIEQVEEALKTTKGQEGYFASLGKMKGKLLPEQPTFEPVEPQLTQPVIDKLYEVVQSNRNYDSFEKLTIQDGLTRVLRGQLPQPHQYPYLEDVFGAKFMEAVMTNKPTLHKIRDIATNILNLPKAFVASFDISAPFRQGVMWTLRPSQVPETARSSAHMFKVLFSEKAYEGWYKQIKEDPLYKTMIKNKVDITDPSVVSRGLSGKEEVFMTNIPKMVVDEPHLKNTPIGWIAQGMRASERAYTGFLNKLRFDLAKRMFSHEIKDGANPKSETRAFKSVAEFVNSSTGRGDLGRLNVVARELNNAFWSPRLVKARLDFLNPGWYARQTPYVRKEAIKGFAEMIGTGISILTLIKLAGGKRVNVETDPRSTDFGKIRIGNTRWDVWGGYQQFVRTFVQVASGQRKTTRGKVVSMSKKKFPFETRLDRIISFAKGKLSPTAALALEISDGQRMFGGNLVPLEEIERKFIPMYIQDIIESYNDLGPHAFWAVAIPAITGVGVQTYQENRPEGAATTAEDLARKLKRKR